MIMPDGTYRATYTLTVRRKFSRSPRTYKVLATPDGTRADIEEIRSKYKKIGFRIGEETFLDKQVQSFTCSRDEMTLEEALQLKIGETWSSAGNDEIYYHVYKEREAAELVSKSLKHLWPAELGKVVTQGLSQYSVGITRLSIDYKPIEKTYCMPDPHTFLNCPNCKQPPKVWIFDNGAFAKCECENAENVSGQTIWEYHKAHNGDMTNWSHADLRDKWNLAQKRKIPAKFGF
jgi:hypothetical protein